MTLPEVSAAAVCPACRGASRHLMAWKFSGLGDSVFNYVADYHACDDCGLVYVGNIDDERLGRFYAEECAYSENAHFDVMSAANQAKYAAYKEVLVSHGLAAKSIADVGCGRGGFLQWLRKSGWGGACCGVDIDTKSIPGSDASDAGVRFECGGALALPFDDGTQDILSYFHVLEHIRDTDRLLEEARRVLKPDGHLLIEVPDAERYREHPIGTAFWISIREHVNHFSSCALVRALRRHGFAARTIVRQPLPTPEFTYPSLMLLAARTDGAEAASCTTGGIADFFLESGRAMLGQAREVSALIDRHGTVTLWGCSAALFSLLPLIDMERVTLCDSSKAKQRSGFRQYPIRDPGEVAKEGMLVVAPYLHGEAIMRAALSLGWPGDAIVRLK